MQFDPNNHVVKRCAQGMSLEGEGKNEEALRCFQQAWDEAENDFEKFTAAHYVARHQKNTSDKLKWDTLALNLALKLNDDKLKGTYPSLYLNIGKCYEDLKDLQNARAHYERALSYTDALADDGYGKMIKGGIQSGLERIHALEKAMPG